MNSTPLKRQLDLLYNKYNNRRYISNDPVEFPHIYRKEDDILLVGFISAIFSYGRVPLFKKILESLFTRIGEEPSYSIKNMSAQDIVAISSGLKYRFYSETDIKTLITILNRILRRYRFIDFISRYTFKRNLLLSIKNLRINILKESDQISPGINFMFPDISSGGASKRILMFFRWMVRKDNIDFGIIKTIKPSELIIPLDTHTAHISRLLGLTRRKANDLKCALEITENLKTLNPDDPIKYDFALAHIGISDGCRHKYIENICKVCFLKNICNNKSI